MMCHRSLRVALSSQAALWLRLTICAAVAGVAGCRTAAPGSACHDAATETPAAHASCRPGLPCWLAHKDIGAGPALSPFLPVPTYDVYNYAETPLVAVPLSEVLPPGDREPATPLEAVPVQPAPVPLPARPGEPDRGGVALEAARGAPEVRPASTVGTGRGTTLRLLTDTLESQPSAQAAEP